MTPQSLPRQPEGPPEGIPQDVWDDAGAFAVADGERFKFARAIMAETKRCAAVCDAFDAPVSDSDFVNGQATAAQQIRAAILRGRA